MCDLKTQLCGLIYGSCRYDSRQLIILSPTVQRLEHRTVLGVSCCTVLLTADTDTAYYPHQQMPNVYIYIYVCVCVCVCVCKQYFIYRKYPYMFRCIRIIFKESHPSTVLKLRTKTLRLQAQ